MNNAWKIIQVEIVGQKIPYKSLDEMYLWENEQEHSCEQTNLWWSKAGVLSIKDTQGVADSHWSV